MKTTTETFEVGAVVREKTGFRVSFVPADRAAAKFALGYRAAEDPGLKPGDKVRVTVELASE